MRANLALIRIVRRGQTSQEIAIADDSFDRPGARHTRQPTAFSRIRRAAIATVSSGVAWTTAFDHPLLQFHAAISVFCATNTRSKSVTESMPTTRKSSTTGNELMR